MKSIANGCRCPGQYKFEFSFVRNDCRPSQKSGMGRENRNAPDSPDLSLFIPDDRGYLRFRVFISQQNLGQSGNSKIPDCLGFFLEPGLSQAKTSVQNQESPTYRDNKRSTVERMPV